MINKFISNTTVLQEFMNYQKIYNQLIIKGKIRTLTGYTERHHIVPRCMGGSDDKSNLVDLTPEEHYLAHQLLVKIYPDNRKLLLAAMCMRKNRPGNKIYGWLRRRFSQAQSTHMTNHGPTKDKRWISNDVETLLVEKKVAEAAIFSGEYIAGKFAKVAPCGHLVAKRCMSCEDKKAKAYDRKRTEAIEMANKLFEEFKQSSATSVGEFAKMIGSSQPRLSLLWKKHVKEYQTYVKPGRSLKKLLTKTD
jgi:hypothetical protein